MGILHGNYHGWWQATACDFVIGMRTISSVGIRGLIPSSPWRKGGVGSFCLSSFSLSFCVSPLLQIVWLWRCHLYHPTGWFQDDHPAVDFRFSVSFGGIPWDGAGGHQSMFPGVRLGIHLHRIAHLLSSYSSWVLACLCNGVPVSEDGVCFMASGGKRKRDWPPCLDREFRELVLFRAFSHEEHLGVLLFWECGMTR